MKILDFLNMLNCHRISPDAVSGGEELLKILLFLQKEQEYFTTVIENIDCDSVTFDVKSPDFITTEKALITIIFPYEYGINTNSLETLIEAINKRMIGQKKYSAYVNTEIDF